MNNRNRRLSNLHTAHPRPHSRPTDLTGFSCKSRCLCSVGRAWRLVCQCWLWQKRMTVRRQTGFFLQHIDRTCFRWCNLHSRRLSLGLGRKLRWMGLDRLDKCWRLLERIYRLSWWRILTCIECRHFWHRFSRSLKADQGRRCWWAGTLWHRLSTQWLRGRRNFQLKGRRQEELLLWSKGWCNLFCSISKFFFNWQ